MRKLFYMHCLTIMSASFCCDAQELLPYTVKIEKDIAYEQNSIGWRTKKFLKNESAGEIIFSEYYLDKKVKLYCNDTLVTDTIITTNPSIGIAENKIHIKTSKLNLIRLAIDEGEILFYYDSRFLFLEIAIINNRIELTYTNNVKERF